MERDRFVSVVIRTKNEERWITSCLASLFRQDYKDFEVILVDNESIDKTVEKAGQYPLAKILTVEDYLPGKALNMGIAASRGGLIACLSGHCIPVDEKWLGSLVRNFFGGDARVAGVYGRQEPMGFTSDSDKRDLALIFGLDRRVQEKDGFFHNANSMIRRSVWEDEPFDETVTNIEDRVWAQKVLKKTFRIVYEPEARVFHYHGIHQNGNAERCRNVVRILESLHSGYKYQSLDLSKMNIVALMPLKGKVHVLNGRPLMWYTIERARKSKYIKRTIVSTDDKEAAETAISLGAEAPFLRDPAFSKETVNIAQVLQYSVKKIEDSKIYPDLIVHLEATFPFRPAGLIDSMIEHLARGGFDSVIAAKVENKAIWKEKEGRIVQLDEGLTPRKFKDPAFLELKGIGCITHPEFVRQGRLLGDKIGIYELADPYSSLEVRSDKDLEMASLLIERCFK